MSSSSESWDRVAERCAEQFGVIGSDHLVLLGVAPGSVRNWTRTRRLEKVATGVWRVVGAPTSWEQRLEIGRLGLGPEALISHEAAAQLHRFEHTPLDRVEFLVPRRIRDRRLDAQVHSTTMLAKIDRVRIGRWPVTSATRTVLDIAMLDPGRRRLEAAIDSAIRSRASSPITLQRRLEALRGTRGRRGCRLVDELVLDAGGESVLERRFLTLMRRAELPRPTTQYPIRDGSRTIGRVDFVWPVHEIVVEVSGGHGHSSPSERTKDAQRRNELQDLGWRVYEYTWSDVTARPWYVTRTMTERLHAAGWRR